LPEDALDRQGKNYQLLRQGGWTSHPRVGALVVILRLRHEQENV